MVQLVDTCYHPTDQTFPTRNYAPNLKFLSISCRKENKTFLRFGNYSSHTRNFYQKYLHVPYRRQFANSLYNFAHPVNM